MAYRIDRVLYSALAVPASTVNGEPVEAWDFDQNRCIAVLSAARKSGAGALDVKLQVSGDRGATWVDYPSGAFTQITGASGSQAMKVDPLGSLVRAVVTVGATTTFDVDVRLCGRGDS